MKSAMIDKRDSPTRLMGMIQAAGRLNSAIVPARVGTAEISPVGRAVEFMLGGCDCGMVVSSQKCCVICNEVWDVMHLILPFQRRRRIKVFETNAVEVCERPLLRAL